MYVKRMYYPITSLGPGNRVVIYTMGCNKRCKGCMSKELQTIDKSCFMDVEKIVNIVNNYYKNDNSLGVTISGGEPFLQEDLYDLVIRIKELGIEDILIYSGYTYKELVEMGKTGIIENIGVLVDGEYIEELNDNLSLRGSSNQRIIFIDDSLMDTYKSYLKRKREIQINVEGNNMDFYGIFPKNMESKIKEILKNKDLTFISSNDKKPKSNILPQE